MSDLKHLQSKVVKFRDERDWKQFHNYKDEALSLVLEAAEVLEHFQWKTGDVLETYSKDKKDDIAEELADVLYWVLLMSNDLEIDISKAFKEKLIKNATKYPVKKAKGSARKYTEL